jgi:hypothetical protein
MSTEPLPPFTGFPHPDSDSPAPGLLWPEGMAEPAFLRVTAGIRSPDPDAAHEAYYTVRPEVDLVMPNGARFVIAMDNPADVAAEKEDFDGDWDEYTGGGEDRLFAAWDVPTEILYQSIPELSEYLAERNK